MLLAIVVIDHDKQTLMEAAGRNNRHAYVDDSLLQTLLNYVDGNISDWNSDEMNDKLHSVYARLDNVLKLLRTP